jgi:hypothetical protein
MIDPNTTAIIRAAEIEDTGVFFTRIRSGFEAELKVLELHSPGVAGGRQIAHRVFDREAAVIHPAGKGSVLLSVHRIDDIFQFDKKSQHIPGVGFEFVQTVDQMDIFASIQFDRSAAGTVDSCVALQKAAPVEPAVSDFAGIFEKITIGQQIILFRIFGSQLSEVGKITKGFSQTAPGIKFGIFFLLEDPVAGKVGKDIIFLCIVFKIMSK